MKSPIAIVVPSLKITGGTKEIVALAHDIVKAGGSARIVAMWRTRDEVDCGSLSVDHLSQREISPFRVLAGILPVLKSFSALKRRHPGVRWMLSHYVTYALVPFIHRDALWFFVQDLEWTFVPTRLRWGLRRLILSALARGRVLTANSYLAAALRDEGISDVATIPIWASRAFKGALDLARDIDVVLVLRRGAHKRVDLAQRVLALREQRYPDMRVAIITPNDEFAAALGTVTNQIVLLRPTIDEMRSLYERARVFLLLSEHEGFGLPPLEAMGSGCVPLCRDAGGVRAYMQRELTENVLPLSLEEEDLLGRVHALSRDETRLARLRGIASQIFDDGLQQVAERPLYLARSGVI